MEDSSGAGMLSDVDIRRALLSNHIRIDPKPSQHSIQPASVDVNLAGAGLVWRQVDNDRFYIDPSKNMRDYMEHVVLPSYVEHPQHNDLFLLHPYQFMLGYVKQHVWVPANITAFLHGRSSLARYGLFIHITAGLLDAGWDGCATLELFNASPYPIRLWAGMSIATVTFQLMSSSSAVPYGHPNRRSKYQSDTIVASSRYHEEVIAEIESMRA